MKTRSFFLLLLVLVIVVAGGFSEAKIKIMLNGVKLALINENGEVEQPIIKDGQVYVPLQSFVETIGGTYIYDESNATATISLNQEINEKSKEKQKVSITSDNFETYFKITCTLTDYRETEAAYDNRALGLDAGIITYGYINVNVQIEPRQSLEINDVGFVYEANLISSLNNSREPVEISGRLSDDGKYSGKVEYKWTVSTTGVGTVKKFTLGTGFITKASGYILEP